MSLFTLLLPVLEQGLALWNSKEKSKYIDRIVKLKKRRLDAYNSSPRRHDIIDDCDDELRILAESFAASPGKPNALD